MAKRTKRSRSRLGAAQKTMGKYLDAGTSKVSETVTTFLANFDTSELVGALKKQAQSAGRAAGRKVGIVAERAPARRKRKTRSTSARKRKTSARRSASASRGATKVAAKRRKKARRK